MKALYKERTHSVVVERIKSVLLLILFVSAVFFAATYIIGTQHVKISPDVNMPVDKLLVFRSGDSDTYASMINEDSLLPEFFAYKIGGVGGGLYANRDLMRDINSTLTDYYKNIFGEASECKITDKEEAEQLWNEALEGNYIYVKYPGSLPYPVINAYHTESSDSVRTSASSDVVYIEELLIVFINNGSPEIVQSADATKVFAISRSSNEYAVYRAVSGALDGISYDTSLITAYNGNKSFISYRFSDQNDDNIKNGSPITTANITANVLEIVRTDPVKFCDNTTARNQMFRLFSFNPDNLSSFNDTGSLVFVADHGSLRFISDGFITYSSSDERGGIELSNILGYGNYGGTYSIYESTRAACGIAELIGKIDQSLIGGSAYLQLKEIEPSDDGVIFTFSYFFNNIPLLEADGSSVALTVKVANNKVVSFRLNTMSVVDTLKSEVVLPAKWVNDNVYTIKNSNGELLLAYVIENTIDTNDNSAETKDNTENNELFDVVKTNNIIEQITDSKVITDVNEYAHCGWIFTSMTTQTNR